MSGGKKNKGKQKEKETKKSKKQKQQEEASGRGKSPHTSVNDWSQPGVTGHDWSQPPAAANDWSQPQAGAQDWTQHTTTTYPWQAAPQPSAYDWSQPIMGKKGKQKGKQVNADAGEALFGGGYPAYYAPGNSWTLGYAGTTPRSAFEGKFAVAETDGEGLFEAYNAMYGRHRPALQRILWAMVR